MDYNRAPKGEDMIPFPLVAVLILGAPELGAQQASRIEVGADQSVALAGLGLPLVEPYLVVHPKDPTHLVATATLVRKPDLSETDCVAITSLDAGRTWWRHDFGLVGCGDSWVAIREDGTVLLSVLGHGPGKESDELLVFRSEDGGRNWKGPASLGGGHDHETIAVDRSSGPFAGSFYVVSAAYGKERATERSRSVVFVARSSDGGASFPEPTRLFVTGLDFNADTPVVLSDGTLVVSFGDFMRHTETGGEWLERERSWVLSSKDGGKTFSVPLMASDVCGRSFGTLAADGSSGPFRDRLYWLCGTYSYQDVLLVRSADRGESWSKSVRVNQGQGLIPHVRTPAMAVNADGVVGIAWYDARNGGPGYKRPFTCHELYFTASLDGGVTFLPEVKVSSKKSCPISLENGEAGWRWPAGGDYMGLAGDSSGAFHLLWADSRDGVYQLRTATVRVTGTSGETR